MIYNRKLIVKADIVQNVAYILNVCNKSNSWTTWVIMIIIIHQLQKINADDSIQYKIDSDIFQII